MLSDFMQVLNSARDVYTKNFIYCNFFTVETEIKSYKLF
jgi:hypothetical protein